MIRRDRRYMLTSIRCPLEEERVEYYPCATARTPKYSMFALLFSMVKYARNKARGFTLCQLYKQQNCADSLL